MRVKLVLAMSVMLFSLFLCVSCGGDGHSCEDGYTWNSDTGECEKDQGGTGDRDSYHPPADTEPNDTDTEAPDSDASDSNENDEVADEDTPYVGDCLHADDKGVVTVDIAQKTLTIGSVTSDITLTSDTVGELWGEHTYTRSTFKIADVNGELAGKSFNMPTATYRLYYHHKLPDGKISDTAIQIGDTVDMNKNQTIDIAVPLVHITGKITKNGAAYPALTGNAADATEVVLSNNSLSFTIPYAQFGSFDLTIPKGTYSLYFRGHFSDSAPLFEGTAVPSTSGIEIGESGTIDFDIPTITVTGTAAIDGAPITTGVLVLLNNPPFGAVAGTLISDFSTPNYSLEIVGGSHTDYTVAYMPAADAYPNNWVKVDQWTGLTASGTHDVSLDFGRLYGTISFKGGNFPALTHCNATDATCTRGKLKLISFSGGSSITIKNLGATGDDYTYEALVVRRISSPDPTDPEKTIYSPRKYTLAFESFYNDLTGIYEHAPFLSEAKYMNSDNVLTSVVDFQKADETYLTQREVNINITPRTVSGSITFNGKAVNCDKDEYIFAKNDKTGDEVPVINMKDISGGKTFSFLIPEGSYTLLYDGSCLLGKRQKAPILHDLQISSDDVTDTDIAIKTSRFLLKHTIDGTPYKEWMKAHKEVTAVHFSVGTKNSALRWELTEEDAGETPALSVLSGESWELSMTVVTGKDEEASQATFPLYSVENMKADVSVETDLPLKIFTSQLTIDGKPMSDADRWRGKLEFGTDSFYSIVYPNKGKTTAVGFVLPGEYKVPSPDIMLNGGFDAKEKLRLNCIYVAP